MTSEYESHPAFCDDADGLWCVIRYGYDFAPPQVVAICGSKEKSIDLLNSIAKDDGYTFPWNGICSHLLKLDAVIDWENEKQDGDIYPTIDTTPK